jgi:hypothetical protein
LILRGNLASRHVPEKRHMRTSPARETPENHGSRASAMFSFPLSRCRPLLRASHGFEGRQGMSGAIEDGQE